MGVGSGVGDGVAVGLGVGEGSGVDVGSGVSVGTGDGIDVAVAAAMVAVGATVAGGAGAADGLESEQAVKRAAAPDNMARANASFRSGNRDKSVPSRTGRAVSVTHMIKTHLCATGCRLGPPPCEPESLGTATGN